MTERPLTIVHTEASCGWGGQDMRVLREAEWFRAQGHTVHIVTPPEAELFRRAKAAGFEPVPMAFKKSTQLGDFFRLRSFLKKVRPDVVGTHSSVDSRVGLFAAASLGVKCRLRYRHVSSIVKRNPVTRFQYAKLATHVITTGDSISRHLVESLGLDPQKISCVSTGVEVPSGLPTREEARRSLCERLGVPESSRFVGQVSVLRSWKGHFNVLDAFAVIADAYPAVRLVFAGDGDPEFRKGLEKHAASKPYGDRVHFAGHTENPWSHHLAYDIEMLASYQGEGIPQSLIQAMFAGTPSVGTTVGGIPEIIDHESCGLLVPPNDPVALGNAIKRLLDEPATATRIAEAALRRVRTERTPTIMVRKTLEIIHHNLARA